MTLQPLQRTLLYLEKGKYADWILATGLAVLILLGFLPVLLTPDSVVFHHDINQFYGMEYSNRRALSEGSIPLWNPYWGLGMPGMAEPQTALFYPPYVLMRAVPVPLHTEFNLLAIGHLWLISWGTYSLMRAWGVRRSSALISALGMMLSGVVVPRIPAGHVAYLAAAAWAPWLLLVYGRLLREWTFQSFLLTNGLLVTLMLAGHPQFGSIVASPLVLYAISVAVTESRAGWRKIAYVVGVSSALMVLALGILTVQFLPTAELLSESPRSELPYEAATEYSVAPYNLLSLFVPYLWIDPTHLDARLTTVPLKLSFELSFMSEITPFVGVLVLVLALLAVFYSPRIYRPHVIFLGVLAAAGLLLSLGNNTPLYRPVYALLPSFKVPGRFLWGWAVGVTALAGFGAENLLRQLESGSTRTLVSLKTPAFLAILGSLLLVLGAAGGVFAVEPLRWYARDLVTLAATVLLLAIILWVIARRNLSALSFGWLVAGAVGLEMLLFAAPLIKPYPVAQFYNPQSPLVQLDLDATRIRLDQGGRNSAFYQVGAPEQFISLELATAHELQALGLEGQRGTQLFSSGYFVSEGPLGEAGSRWLQAGVFTSETPSDLPDLRLIQQQGNAYLYESPGNLPRIYAVPAVRVVADQQKALDYIRNDFAVDRLAVVVSHDVSPGLPTTASQPVRFEGRFVDYGLNSLTAEVSLDRPAMVIFGEAYYPGWLAEVDGEPATIWQANYAYRGVVVSEGSHLITMTYAAPTFWRGMRISGATLGILLLLTAGWTIRRLQTARRPHPPQASEHAPV